MGRTSKLWGIIFYHIVVGHVTWSALSRAAAAAEGGQFVYNIVVKVE